MPSFVEENIAQAEEIKRREDMAIYESELEKQTKARIKEEYIKRKKELIDGFLESTVSSMRQYVAELCDTVLLSIGKGGKNKVSVAHIAKLKDMIRKIKLLNFYNDSDISKLMKDLDLELDKIKSEIDNNFIVDKLKEIIDASKKEYCYQVPDTRAL